MVIYNGPGTGDKETWTQGLPKLKMDQSCAQNAQK